MVVLNKGTDVFQYVSERNRARQYDFLRTAFEVYKNVHFPLGKDFLCDLNFYAVQYLSQQPGRYRHEYNVEVGNHTPCDWTAVEPSMANFWRILHEKWNDMSPLEAAAFALWGVNYIHPFAEGNGRSSRALAYFIICVKLDYWLPGSDTITEQIRIVHRSNYCEILNRMDKAMKSDGTTDLTEMVALLDQLMLVQLRSAP